MDDSSGAGVEIDGQAAGSELRCKTSLQESAQRSQIGFIGRDRASAVRLGVTQNQLRPKVGPNYSPHKTRNSRFNISFGIYPERVLKNTCVLSAFWKRK